MGKRDPRVDAYIAKAADFAKPILIKIRDTVHAVCPDVEEDMKWSSPTFMYHGMLCGMSSFKQHAMFGFWKGSLVVDDAATDSHPARTFPRLTKVSDLPSKQTLTALIRKAMALNEQGIKVPRSPRGPAKPVVVPDDLAAALRKNKKAQVAFDEFPPSHRREYAEWIADAKREETRARRLRAAVKQIADGKPQNWKYMK